MSQVTTSETTFVFRAAATWCNWVLVSLSCLVLAVMLGRSFQEYIYPLTILELPSVLLVASGFFYGRIRKPELAFSVAVFTGVIAAAGFVIMNCVAYEIAQSLRESRLMDRRQIIGNDVLGVAFLIQANCVVVLFLSGAAHRLRLAFKKDDDEAELSEQSSD